MEGEKVLPGSKVRVVMGEVEAAVVGVWLSAMRWRRGEEERLPQADILREGRRRWKKKGRCSRVGTSEVYDSGKVYADAVIPCASC